MAATMERLTDDQRDLAERYVSFAKRLARNHVQQWPWLATDLESEALYSLSIAAGDYDETRGVKFSTYAAKEIRWAMLTMIDNAKRNRDRFRTNIVKARMEGIVDPRPDSSRIENTEEAAAYLRRLSNRQMEACYLVYIAGHSQTRAAYLMNCTQSYVSMLLQAAFAAMRASNRFQGAA